MTVLTRTRGELAALRPGRKRQPAVARPIRVMTFLSPNLRRVYQAIVEHVGRKLGRPTELAVGKSYAELAEADFAFPPLPRVHLGR